MNMIRNRWLSLAICCLLGCSVARTDAAEVISLNAGWEFGMYAGAGRKMLSAPGKAEYLDYSVVLENADGGFADGGAAHDADSRDVRLWV